MADSKWCQLFFGSAEIKRKIIPSGVFGVAENEFEVRFSKNKMADPKWCQRFFDSAKMKRKISLSGVFGVAEFEFLSHINLNKKLWFLTVFNYIFSFSLFRYHR